jgi:hypothetical protein
MFMLKQEMGIYWHQGGSWQIILYVENGCHHDL